MDLGLHNKLRHSDIANVIKVCLMECLGHVVRICTRTGKKLLNDKPGGGIKRGRPRIRWTDIDESNLRNMEQELWTEQSEHLS